MSKHSCPYCECAESLESFDRVESNIRRHALEKIMREAEKRGDQIAIARLMREFQALL